MPSARGKRSRKRRLRNRSRQPRNHTYDSEQDRIIRHLAVDKIAIRIADWRSEAEAFSKFMYTFDLLVPMHEADIEHQHRLHQQQQQLEALLKHLIQKEIEAEGRAPEGMKLLFDQLIQDKNQFLSHTLAG